MDSPKQLSPKERLDRHRQFRAALALAGRSARHFAESIGVHHNHLHFVLRGDRESRRVDKLVDAFIAEYLEDGEVPVPPMPSRTPEAR